MSVSLTQVLDRARQNREALERTARERLAAAARRAAGPAGTFLAGDVVFDTVSGQLAEVVHGTRENIVVSTPKQ